MSFLSRRFDERLMAMVTVVPVQDEKVRELERRVAELERELAEYRKVYPRDILERDFLMVADKEWYCGQLIQELHAQYGVAVLTPVKSSPKRLEEFDAVPLEQYDQTIWGNVAALYTTMTDFDGPLRMLLKKRRNGTYFALITPAHAMTAATAMPTYTKRWRIESVPQAHRKEAWYELSTCV